MAHRRSDRALGLLTGTSHAWLDAGTEAHMETKAIEKELLNLERQYWQAIKDKDIDTVLRLSDNPCLIAGSQGFASIDKEILESMMKSAKYTLNEFRFGDGKPRVLSDDVAILA